MHNQIMDCGEKIHLVHAGMLVILQDVSSAYTAVNEVSVLFVQKLLSKFVFGFIAHCQQTAYSCGCVKVWRHKYSPNSFFHV